MKFSVPDPDSPLALIFDLDGTLWDTCPACAVAWNRALAQLQIPYREILTADMRGVAGLPHGECVRQVLSDLSPDQQGAVEALTAKGDIDAIRELGGELFAGVAKGLHILRSRHELYIVSNCQSGYIELFYEFSGLGSLFADQECWGNTGLAKAANLQSLMERNQLSQAVYLGDTLGDAEAAAACQVPFVHAGWGYGVVSDVPSFANFDEFLAGSWFD